MKQIQRMVCFLALAGSAGGFLGSWHSALRVKATPRPALHGSQIQDLNFAAKASPRPKSPAAIAEWSMSPVGSPADNRSSRSKDPFSLPVSFEPNMGQADHHIRLLGRGRGLNVYLTSRGIDLQIPGVPGGTPNPPAAIRESAAPGLLRMTLAGDAPLDWVGTEKLNGVSNYLIGNDRRRWHTGVPHFARAETGAPKDQRGNSISVQIYDNGKNLEYDLRLAPGADPKKVRLQIAVRKQII